MLLNIQVLRSGTAFGKDIFCIFFFTSWSRKKHPLRHGTCSFSPFHHLKKILSRLPLSRLLNYGVIMRSLGRWSTLPTLRKPPPSSRSSDCLFPPAGDNMPSPPSPIEGKSKAVPAPGRPTTNLLSRSRNPPSRLCMRTV